MPSSTIDPRQFLETAYTHYQKGNLAQADAMCRHLIANNRERPHAYNLLGMISLSINMPGHALTYFKKALRIDPSHGLAKKNLRTAKKESKKKTRRKSAKQKFLLIKAWGSGFWADIDHVLGQLLLAEITGRTPIVLWGKNSLYHDGTCDNAFELYFEPVSDCTPEQLSTEGLSYFPPKWNQHNYNVPEINKSDGDYSRMASLYFLNRNENVIIGDFHTYISDLLPWIEPRNPLSKKSPQQVYHYLIKKYIHLKPDIIEEITRYWSEQIKGKQVLAVHIRGSDKIIESTELNEINLQYHGEIEKHLSRMSNAFIFLLTDSSLILDEYKKKYGDKLFYRDCARTESTVGIHYQEHSDKRHIGIEIIIDTYIASMCHAFVGYGGTNVSTSILHLKDWAGHDVTLLGDNALFQPHLFLHDR